MSAEQKPTIHPATNGPYLVEGLESLTGPKGPIEAKPKMALCRCGRSSNKPFCDGTHAKIGFSSDKLGGGNPDRVDDYTGGAITVHDNRSICAHAGRCTDGLPAVFRLRQEPFVDPDGAGAEEVMKVVGTCPSGALSYTHEGRPGPVRSAAPSIFVAPNGPYVVTGGAELLDTVFGKGASTEQFTLCRCGGSKNKPFCDGTHWSNGFQD